MGKVVAAPWGGHVVTSYDLCDHVLRSREDWLELDASWRGRQPESARWTSLASREMSRTLPSLNGEEHQRVRRSAGSMFGGSALDDLQAPVTVITRKLLDRLEEELDAGEGDFHVTVSEELPVATIGHWLALPEADHPLLRELTRDMVYTQELLPSASQLAHSDLAIGRLRRYFRSLIAERRNHLGDDPVSRWIVAWDRIERDRDAADDGVYHLVLFVLLAALETTASMLSQVVLALMNHPAQWDHLTRHPEDVPGAVEEALRYDPPTHVITRVARHDTVLEGVEVKADETVHLMVAAAGRDPERHNDPDSFDIHRRRQGHLAFSSGVHYCLGAPLARLEAHTLLHGLLRRFPRLHLARTPQWAPRVVFRRPRSLPVALA
ncbi:cytochrome P450 [Actinacidiphila acidipaludis]|uniref:Cytochrome P450 n=1 Tax=Actinacidiphila acidipaludis TaxID=2873382 RepID=A0ABS7QGH2_9ACTN|nr:cytochrome P450 [Streptomyces acidipaludis]MBY8880874.1 cytochrome P450 [Streptomyces acidipaludis]